MRMMGDDFSALLGAEFTDGLGQVDSEQATTTSIPGLPKAYKAGEIIPGTSWRYWDGNLSNHSWPTHGWGGAGKTGDYSGNAEDGPRITFDNTGIMACRVSHYVAQYDNTETFLGFTPLRTERELPEAAYAGQMIATVVQYFHHENYIITPLGELSINSAREPYKYYKNKTISPNDFFFLEREVAIQGKDRADKDGVTTQRYQADDAKKGELKIGKYTGLPHRNRKSRRERYLVRDFAEKTFIGSRKAGTSKINYAITPQWIFPSSNGELSATTSANTTNEFGKAVWIYRFPKQLDEATRQTEIDHWVNQHGVDYSMANTKNAYPFPTFRKNVNLLSKISFSKQIEVFDNYSVLGRMEFISGEPDDKPLAASKNNGLDATNKLQLVEEEEETIRLTRKEIPIVPMIGTAQAQEVLGIEYYFDTTHTGSKIEMRLTDPETYTYLSRPAINYVYFPQRGFSRVGDKFLVIGQALLPYDDNNIDSKLNRLHNSERMVLALEDVTEVSIESAIERGRRSIVVNPDRRTSDARPGDEKWDFLVPKATVTTADVENRVYTPGFESLNQFIQENSSSGGSLILPWISSLDLRSTIADTKPSSKPGYYETQLAGITFSFPYSIALFEIYEGYQGPILELNEEDEYITTAPGSIRVFDDFGDDDPTDAYFLYFTQTGKTVKQKARFRKAVVETTGDMEEDLERTGLTDDPEDVTLQLTFEQAQIDMWLAKYKNKFFVIPGSMSQYFIPGSDRVTGQQIYDAWVSSGAAFELPLFNPSANFAGIGSLPFKKTFGVVVEDVTEKWGEIGSNRARYTGDMNMQAVQRGADVGAEQLGYVAMTATHDDLGGPFDFITDPVQGKVDAVEKKVDSAIDTAKVAVEGGAGILLGVQGGILLGAGLGAIFVAALAAPAAIEKVRDTVGDIKEIEAKEQRRLPAPE